MCLHYVKKCSKSEPTDRLKPAGNGYKMSELNLESARLIGKCLKEQLVRAID